MKFTGEITRVTIFGPYAVYEGFVTLTLCDEQGLNCQEFEATLFTPGSNVKDTGQVRGGAKRGFDDFNIAVVYGDNLFVTANGFVETGKSL